MNLSSVVAVVFVSCLGIAACTKADDTNNERTAACTDRTNGISCMGCCQTKDSSFATKVCICKGESLPGAAGSAAPAAPK